MKATQILQSILLLVTVMFLTTPPLLAQGPTSFTGDRENVGIFGGQAADLAYSGIDNRIFAAVETPFTLFYSDDTCKNWQPAFTIDSMEYALGNRGWGGGAFRVLSNRKGWVAAHTGLTTSFSSGVISYDNGNQFQTAFDPYLLHQLTGNSEDVQAVGLSDHFCLIAFDKHIIRTNDTLPGEIILHINDLPGTPPGSFFRSVAPSNDPSGYPYYAIVNVGFQQTKLYVIYSGVYFELPAPATNSQFQDVFTNPAGTNGDTLFVSLRDTTTNSWFHYRSFTGGFPWTDITPFMNPGLPIHDVDYSDEWLIQDPASGGLRISFAGGIISDDLGNSWQGPAAGLETFGIATHPENKQFIIGSNNTGVAISNSGLPGPFINPANIGFASLTVNDFSESQGIYYVATSSGLAYTQEYFNPLISGYDQWVLPNGIFPDPSTPSFSGITSVAADPANPEHVVCGYDNGFFVSFNGAGNFIPVTPIDWNSNPHLDPFVTDILFINSMTILATTGMKFQPMPFSPPQSIGNIWRSDDGGLNWYLVTPIFPIEYQMGNCLAVGNNGTQTIIYSGTGYRQPGSINVAGGIWVSFDFGDTWNKVNDAPTDAQGFPMPVYDIDVDPGNNELLWITTQQAIARSNDGGLSYFIADVPGNLGEFTSALIDPFFTDSIVITCGRSILKYSFLIDDADHVFKGLPGERFISSSFGSILGGSNTGGSKITGAPTHFLDLKVYLEGPFTGTEMNTNLNASGYLPLNQPFNQEPWNYDGTEHASAIPNPDIVDWVLIELRKTQGDPSTATSDTRFDRKAAFLMKDGTITDDDGSTMPRFNIILQNSKGSDKMHGVVYSPGHTGLRTADSLTQAKSLTFSYDFTTDPEAAFGGKSSHKEIAPGIWGMYSGDGNNDNQVDNSDKNEVWSVQQGNTGYFSGDFNRDGEVDLTDLNDYWKPNTGKGSQID